MPERTSPKLLLGGLVWVSLLATCQAAIAPGTLCEVTGDGVNLRADSRVTAPSLGKAHVGDLVTVKRHNMGWYLVTPPDSFDVWMHGKYVDEGTGQVTGDNVNLRTGPGTGNHVLGRVSRRDAVAVAGHKGDWVRVRSPDRIGVWIHGKFVKEAAQGSRAPAEETHGTGASASSAPILVDSPAPASSGRQLTTTESPEVLELVRRADAIYEASVIGGEVKGDLTPARDLYLQAQTAATSAGTRHHVDLRLTEIALREELGGNASSDQEYYTSTISELERENERLRTEYEYRLAELATELERERAAENAAAANAPSTARNFTAVGWTWPMGKIWKRPGTHRLVVGGRTLYYLNSRDVDLNADELWKRHIGVVGTVRVVDGWDHPVIDVTAVEVVETDEDAPESLYWMRK